MDHHCWGAGLLGHGPPRGCWDTCRANKAVAPSEAMKRPTSQPYWKRYQTLHFNWSWRGGRAMVVNSYAGVDPSVLRHHITDLQQDVPCVSAKTNQVERVTWQKTWKQSQTKPKRSVCYLMSTVKRLLLVTGFWSGPFRVMEGLGRPQTLQQRTTVSPNAQTTSDRGLRNSGATVHKKPPW